MPPTVRKKGDAPTLPLSDRTLNRLTQVFKLLSDAATVVPVRRAKIRWGGPSIRKFGFAAAPAMTRTEPSPTVSSVTTSSPARIWIVTLDP